MLFLITFLEGLISFLSPCFLPLLPVYLAYFAGDADGGQNDRRTLAHAGLFVLGFTLVFILLGVGAGAVGEGFNPVGEEFVEARGEGLAVFAEGGRFEGVGDGAAVGLGQVGLDEDVGEGALSEVAVVGLDG